MANKPNFGGPVDEDMFELDGLDDIENKFLVADGDFELKLVDINKETSARGNPMWVLDFTIVGPTDQGKEFKYWVTLTSAALWKAAQTLAALGVHQEGNARASFKKSDIVGKHVIGTFVAQAYEGRMSSKIKTIRPMGTDAEA